ncbi:MAG: hypothetical protein WBB85_08425 [Albidovulum sp.]|uniref:hypothetical protein n=1 Tax=Albidovulum sp. TaxID=1872424 RepID=UPI003CB5E009
MRLLIAFALSALLALPAFARPLATDEMDTLGKAVDGYLAAIEKADAPAIVSALPPRILNVFAGATGTEAKKLEATLVDQTKAMMKDSRFRDLAYGRSQLVAEDAALADGTAVTWVLIPTAFVSETKSGKTKHEQPLLALNEGGDWYFLRIDGPQSQQLAAIAYPFLAEIEFPPSLASAVK